MYWLNIAWDLGKKSNNMNQAETTGDKWVGGISVLEMEKRGRTFQGQFGINYEFVLFCDIIETRVQNSSMWLFIQFLVLIK